MIEQTNIYLGSALCIGCLISIIRAAPTLPSSTDRDQFQPPTLLHVSRTTVAEADWTPSGSTYNSITETKVPEGGKRNRAFVAYVATNPAPTALRNTLRAPTDPVELKPVLSSILQRLGAKTTAPLSSNHSSIGLKYPRTRKNTLIPYVSRVPETRNLGLVLAHRSTKNAQSNSSLPELKSNIDGEEKTKDRIQTKKPALTPLRSSRPRSTIMRPETWKSRLTPTRNQGLLLMGLTSPSGPKKSRQMSMRRSTRKLVTNANGHKIHRNISIPVELTIPMKYLARAKYEKAIKYRPRNAEEENDEEEEEEEDEEEEEEEDKEDEEEDEEEVEEDVDIDHYQKTNTIQYTDPPVWMDTRYHFQHNSRQPRLRLESNPLLEYYPDDKNIEVVCRDQSTIIGTDIVTSFIKPYIYQKSYGKRNLYRKWRDDLTRLQLLGYCHTPGQTSVFSFLECITDRHMAFESLLPKYPYHQVQAGPQ
ncbi:uncharacterized protein [Drosophila pseudoobscura]|uniref:Uncharacterized protein n=1 Tax=Drosophila pseudoobscura pseudoobscura TaxID=46245 RepID=A0A6I8VB33_DROPS|nr:uncharacterized protein LOC26532647 [Drosophila pseudoobscura]